MKMNKKGVIEQLQAMIVPIIGIAIVLVVGFLIFSEAKDQVVQIDTTTALVTNNETIAFVNNTLTTLTNHNCMTLSCSRVDNNTATGGIIPSACYTCGVAGITVLNYSITCVPDKSLNVTYSCQQTTAAYNATGTLQNATQDIPGWLPIIIITIIGAILIGLVARFRASRQ